MATRETEAGAALEACAAFWRDREPFKVRDPRLDPIDRDTLSDARNGDTITVADVTLNGGEVVSVRVTRENKYGAVKRFRFDLEAWRSVARALRVIYVAGYQAGETAPGRVLS